METNSDFFFYALKTLIDHEAFSDPKFKDFLNLKAQKFQDQEKFYNDTQKLYQELTMQFNEFKVTDQIPGKKKVRGLVDGVFDMTHFGHYNMLRQASLFCDEVVVCINADESVKKHKGPTLLNEQERKLLVENCKWVQEVVIVPEYIQKLEILEETNCDFVIHGDDIINDENGENIYTPFEKLNKLRICNRTTGISTTDIVYKILNRDDEKFQEKNRLQQQNNYHYSIGTLQMFRQDMKKKTGKVVYTGGSFDVLNPGHIEFLKKAREQGDYLIVGVYSNEKIKQEKNNSNYPILGMYERVLNLLALKQVDDVILNAPLTIDQHFIEEIGIDLIVHGKNHYVYLEEQEQFDKVPKELILEIDSGSNFNFKELADRVEKQRDIYEKAIQKKLEKLEEYYENKNN